MSRCTAKIYCCDRKSRAACAQSFALWQQATTEIKLAISLTIACSRYIYYGFILHAHPVRGESHNQRNATGEVATLRLCFIKSNRISAIKRMPFHIHHIFIFVCFRGSVCSLLLACLLNVTALGVGAETVCHTFKHFLITIERPAIWGLIFKA